MKTSPCLALLAFALLADLGAQVVPADLRPLLTPKPSRVGLIAERYAADRRQLDRFYATPLSTTHLARMLRFDVDWLAALGALDTAGLDADERGDLAALRETVGTNMRGLETTAASHARVRPLLPFASAIEAVLEARRRVLPIDAQQSAATIAAITRRIGELTADLEAGRLAIPTAAAGQAAADAARALRGATRDWFRFYDGYDPLFTWWMAKPYADFGPALDAYTALLREKAGGVAEPPPADAAAVELEPAPPPAHAYVPDLGALLAYPHNEMIGVWQAFRGRGARGSRGARGGRGSRRGGRGPRSPRTEEQYRAWLAALKTLDFDALSRSAQVSYLALRKDCEVGLRRLATPRQTEIPHVPDDSGITGRPIGRAALELSLADEMIAYTPEELIAIGDAEYAWCMKEMLAASKELGHAERWRDALEQVKTRHVAPGEQPVLIRELMFEAVDFLREHDLVTVPQVAAETLSMIMMTPARQLVNPFFTGGARISVSFPTATMAHDAKLQSMRGNNVPFSRATVHHELIPGHNLQHFVDRRFAATRAGSRRTPFHSEGWAVYFEMLLYRMRFPRLAAARAGGPSAAENRIGFLFWRMHRCARITFSLRYHLGLWSAQQCIDFLVDGVGHERDNATAEVRRSFAGSYGPLYQAGYLLGAIQFRQLAAELVESGAMRARDFHDAIVRAGPMPVALVRLLLDDRKLTPDMPLEWKFYGEEIPGTGK